MQLTAKLSIRAVPGSQKSGSWFSMGDERIGQGKDNAKEFLLSHPEVMEEVENKLREAIISGNSAPKDDLDGDD